MVKLLIHNRYCSLVLNTFPGSQWVELDVSLAVLDWRLVTQWQTSRIEGSVEDSIVLHNLMMIAQIIWNVSFYFLSSVMSFFFFPLFLFFSSCLTCLSLGNLSRKNTIMRNGKLQLYAWAPILLKVTPILPLAIVGLKPGLASDALYQELMMWIGLHKHWQSVGVRSCETNSLSAFLYRCSVLHPFSQSCQVCMTCSYFQLSVSWTLILFLFILLTEIMRSNGFCLANTETIVIDHSIPNGKEKHLDVDSAEHL